MRSPGKIGRSKNPFVGFLKALVDHGLENAGKYYSIYRAYVADNEDPENLHRLQLIIPQVSGMWRYKYWAFPTGVPSGENHGLQIIPKKGDMVWVQFEGGQPEIPVWSHGHFTRNEIPKDDPDLKDVNCYWFITAAGHKVKFNDTKKTIHIHSAFGEEVVLNDKGVSIVTTKGISQGSLNQSSYHAVLGEELQDVLKDVEDVLNKFQGAMQKDIIALTAANLTNVIKYLPTMKTTIAGLSGKIQKILSNLVTLNK